MRALFVRRVLVLVALLVLLCLARVWLGNQIVRIGYDLSDARQMRTRLEQEKQALEVELTMLKDRGKVEERARRRLGMTEPRKGQVVDLR
jgi:cell division protein FtsL